MELNQLSSQLMIIMIMIIMIIIIIIIIIMIIIIIIIIIIITIIIIIIIIIIITYIITYIIVSQHVQLAYGLRKYRWISKFQVQHRATKLIPEISHLPYHDRLKYLNLTTLELRRHRGDLIETFKVLKGFEGIPSNSLFELNTSVTRGNSLKIKIEHQI